MQSIALAASEEKVANDDDDQSGRCLVATMRATARAADIIFWSGFEPAKMKSWEEQEQERYCDDRECVWCWHKCIEVIVGNVKRGVTLLLALLEIR